MKEFLYMAAFVAFAQVIGAFHALGDGIPLRLDAEGGAILLLVPLLILAWWLSRP